MTTRIFLAGLAAEPALRQAVLGPHQAQGHEAPGLTLVAASHGPWPVPCLEPGAVLKGVALDLDPSQAARLDFVLQSLGLRPVALSQACAYLGRGQGEAPPLAPQDLAVVLATVEDILALQSSLSPAAILARLTPMMVRAASRLRALAEPTPTRHRHAAGAGDIRLARQRFPYAHFFALEEYDVSWRRFAGPQSETVTRAVFLSGDAVTVLPYDPLRDRVLVVEQFRAGPLARGDRECWQIEPIAGRVDPFETPETAAHREAVEEAGLTLRELLPVSSYYPSPGAVSEYLYSYVALTDLPDGSAGVFGVEDEAEDIRGHLLPFATLMDMVASGEVQNAPLILTALWLQRERARLRQV